MADTKSDWSAWQEGDLIFFSDGSISHVGIYLGNGEMIHALNEKYNTRIDNVFAYDAWDTGLYLHSVGRFL